jgi:hypothetical protein
MLVDDIADQIAIARLDELDWIIRDMWVDHTHGLLTDNEMEALDEAARTRREAIQTRRPEARSRAPSAPPNAPRGATRRRVDPVGCCNEYSRVGPRPSSTADMQSFKRV